MVYAGGRFKIDAMMRLAQPIGKFGLEMVADAHEILVEAPDSQSELAPNREIATHELTDPGGAVLGKVKATRLRQDSYPPPMAE